MLMRKPIIVFDQDNSTVDSMAPLVKRNSDLMRSLLFSKRVLARLPADLRAQAALEPERYFIDQIIRLKGDFYAAARRKHVEVWDKTVVLPETDFMRDHWESPSAAARHYLRRHFTPLSPKPFAGMEETIRGFKQAGATLVMLTDAVPPHAMSIALSSGFVDGLFDLVVSRDDMRPAEAGAKLALAPYAGTVFKHTPHYAALNVQSYPKKHAQTYDLLAALLKADKADMVLIDDHLGVCDTAREAGVDPLLAYYGSIGDEFRRDLKWLREWTDYYAIQDDFHEAMARAPEIAANGHTVLRRVDDIAAHIQPVKGAVRLPHIESRAGVRLSGNGKPEIFIP